jgi:hypothetical protein
LFVFFDDNFFKNFKCKNRGVKIKNNKMKNINLPITALESCHSQQHTPLIIEACKAPHTRPLFAFLSIKRRGGYPEAPF